MRRLATACLAVALSAGLALPAVADKPEHIPDHESCQGFGEVFRDWAQGGAEAVGFKNGGQGIKYTAHNGSVSQVIHLEHDLFCDPR